MNFYRKAIDSLDWGSARQVAPGAEPAIVIGHKTPDGDSVMSALAYVRLMQELGYNVVARMAGKANNETVFAAKAFGFDLPEILLKVEPQAASRNGEPTRLILVDHSDYAQAVDGARDARILQVMDHHGIGDIAESKLLYAKYMPVGSTCSIVYISFKELDVEITAEVAKILLAGIMADTLNLIKVTCTDMDRTIYQELVAILSAAENVSYAEEFEKIQKIYQGMSAASRNFDGMTDEEIFNSDAKDYEIAGVRFRLGSLDWPHEDSIDSFNDRMLAVMKNLVEDPGGASSNSSYRMAFCRVGFKETSFILYRGGTSAQAVAETAFGKSVRPGVIFCERRLSRKLDVIPMLTKALIG